MGWLTGGGTGVKMRVFINPGHAPGGRPDTGAINKESGLRECDVALDISRHVKRYLELAGCTVTMVQSNNLFGEADGVNVVETANRQKCDIFVSIHCNAFNGKARGAETLCYSVYAKSADLAKCIQFQLAAAVRRADMTFPDRGVKSRPGLVVLNSTAMPAALVETAFIDNREDAAILINYSQEIAAAIARGITDYWQSM